MSVIKVQLSSLTAAEYLAQKTLAQNDPQISDLVFDDNLKTLSCTITK